MKTRVFAVCVVVFLFCGITHAGLSDGLIAYYPFNGNANDESGNGHNGIVNGTGATLTNDRFGNANKAYSFNGTGSYIRVNVNTADWFYNDFSIAVWVNFRNFTNPFPMIIYGENDNVEFHGMGPAYSVDEQKRVTFYQQNRAGFTSRIGEMRSSKLNENEWYLITIVKSNLQFKMYSNSSVSASVSSSTNVIMDGTFITIGSRKTDGSDFSVDGSIDDVRIYNRALSASEIQQLYQDQGACSSEVVKFTAGTPAKAADVNANFDSVNCQIQVLNSQLQALKAIVCKNEPTASVCQ
jgi:hypothetical protein